MQKRRAFTLIELLIVVAIIAILAAIAVPNFLEAQVRAKVSRAKSDMRTTATAIESYRVDSNTYPIPADEAGEYPAPAPGDPFFDQTVPWIITTPIAYMSSLPADPFNQVVGIVHHYHYGTRKRAKDVDNDEARFDEYVKVCTGGSGSAAQYFLLSHGPNLDHDPPSDTENPPWRDGALYDPTNGTVSHGDVLYFGPGIGMK